MRQPGETEGSGAGMTSPRRPSITFLLILAGLAFTGGFYVYGFVRVMSFSAALSWPALWRGMLAMSICGSVPVGFGIGAFMLWRLVGERPIRRPVGTCKVCSYQLGVAGLDRCPECGHVVTETIPPRRFPITFKIVAVIAIALFLGAGSGALVSDLLIQRDERAFLSEVAVHRASPQAHTLYGRSRVFPYSGHRMNYYGGRVELTD